MGQHNFRETARRQGTTSNLESTGTSAQTTVMSTLMSAKAGEAVSLQLIARGNGTFKVGTNPTAINTGDGGTYLAAGTGTITIVYPTEKVAWISDTGTTSVNITNLI